MRNVVYLVNCGPLKNYSIKNRIYFPTLLLYLGTLLKQAGFDVRVLDRMIEQITIDGLRREIESQRDSLLAVVLHFTTKDVPEAVEIADYSKEIAPEIPIVAFGLHGTMYPFQVLEDSSFDLLIHGDGEPCVVGLMRSLQSGGSPVDLPNVWTKENGHIRSAARSIWMNMDDLPVPEFDLLPMDQYLNRDIGFLTGDFRKIRVFRFSASRGCIYRCSFCTDPFKGYQRMSNRTIIRHLNAVVQKFDPDVIFFDDPEFFIKKDETLRLMNEFERRYRFRCVTTSRAQYYRDDYISLEVMKRFADRWVLWDMGAETSNATRLKDIRKGINLDNLRRAADMAGEAGVRVGFSFMVAMPGETEEEMIDTLLFIEELKKRARGNILITYQYYQPIGTTVMATQAESLGFAAPRTLREWRATFDRKTGSTSIYLHRWVKRPAFVNYCMMVVKYVINEIYPPEEEDLARIISSSWARRKATGDWTSLPECKEADERGISFFTPRDLWTSAL